MSLFHGRINARASIANREPLATGAYIFVFAVFLVLALAFAASTALLYLEFHETDWLAIVFAHSHLFFFFPVFGVVALAAFYIPCVVFTDYYWSPKPAPHGLKWGRVRFIFGMLVVLLTALWFTYDLAGKLPRGVWEVSPAAMQTDQPVPIPGCRDGEQKTCVRQPILQTLADLRGKAQTRSTITEFARPCLPDPLVETPNATTVLRYCFPAKAHMTADACCKVQRQFRDDVSAKADNVRMRSNLSQYEMVLTFAKSFFILVLLVVSALLVLWQHSIQHLYRYRLEDIERGIIVGSIAMLFWLLMDYGYQQTSDVLFGRDKPGFVARLSVIVAVWSVLLIIYFLGRVDSQQFNMAQISTIVASAVAIFQYEQVGNLSMKVLGIGANTMNFAGLVLLAVILVELVYGPVKLPLPRMRRPKYDQLT